MLSPSWIFLGFLWVFSQTGISCVSGSLSYEKNSLKVTSPESLHGYYDSAIGNFGISKLGGSIAGTVVYPNKNKMGCHEFGQSFEEEPNALPTFLLLDRGDCYFAIKAWRAQEAGASAVLVADDAVQGPLINMDSLSESKIYIDLNIEIPFAFISKQLGDQLKKAVEAGEIVNINLDWRETLPDPKVGLEYELWTTSNYDCGPKCDMVLELVKNIKDMAQALEQARYTRFTPHYVTWYCPEAFDWSRQCRSQCINRGRYCAPDPSQDFRKGYEGKDVVVENLRQLCVFRVANESDRPWIWWDYVTEFQLRCPMNQKKFNKQCADAVIESLELDGEKIERCMGDIDIDSDNPVLKEELDAHVEKQGMGIITTLPTIVINNRQYEGKLDRRSVVRAVWGRVEPMIGMTSRSGQFREKIERDMGNLKVDSNYPVLKKERDKGDLSFHSHNPVLKEQRGEGVVRVDCHNTFLTEERGKAVVRVVSCNPLLKEERGKGDTKVDSDKPVLKEEQDADIGKGGKANVPAVLLKNRQSRGNVVAGRLERAAAVVNAIFPRSLVVEARKLRLKLFFNIGT